MLGTKVHERQPETNVILKVDGGGSRPSVLAVYEEELCPAVNVYRLI